MEKESPKHPPVWIFGLLQIPYGIAGAFTSTTLGAILAKNGVPEAKIATVVSLSILIAAIQFLWSPIVDIGFKRKNWYMILSFIGGLSLTGSMFIPLPSHVDTFIWVFLASQLASTLTSACIGGLMATTLPDEVRGRAAGFSNAGNVGAGAIGAGFSLYFAESHSMPVVGIITGVMLSVPSLVALFIHEPPPVKRRLVETFRSMLREVWSTAKAYSGWTGILICCSPVGTAAVMQLFTSFSKSYQATDRMVTIVNGFVGGIVTTVACILGGYICDRMNRRTAYMLAGLLTAICASIIALCPFTPQTYIWGSLAYLFVSGFCYAAFTALVLEVIGNAGATASTQYTLFTAAGNLAIAYVVKLEGFGFDIWEHTFSKDFAPRGILWADALLNLAGIAILITLLRLFRPKTTAVATAK